MDKELAVVPTFELTINGKNVTQDVSAWVSTVEFKDRLEEASSEVQIVFNDIAGLWQGTWYPQQSDSLNLKLGYKGRKLLDCGDFEIDEIELKGQPDEMTVKAIAAAISKDLRTRKSRAFEKQTLHQIAKKIADDNGLKMMGDTSKLSNIEVGRKTQDNQSDLAFLAETSKKFGIIFSVRGKDLVFLNPEDLEKTPSIAEYKRQQLSSYSFKDKTADTYESASVSRRDVKTNSVKHWSVKSSGDPTKKDEIVVGGRVENDSQAQAVSKGAIREQNKDKLTGSFSIDGNPSLVSGANVDLKEFGQFSGKWTIKESTHKIDVSSGYTTSVTIRKGPYAKKYEVVKGGTDNNSKSEDWTKIYDK